MDNSIDIKQFYEISDEEKLRQAKIIYDLNTYEKPASDRPFAVIVIGQPGAGKSGVMSYTGSQYPTAVSLDIDEFRQFYPRYDELQNKNPELYSPVTGKFATDMIHILTPVLIQNKHNLILHKTRGDEAIIADTIEPLRANGYNIIIKVLAVNHLESKISALDRSISEREKLNYCRWVLIDYHNQQYRTIPLLIDKFEREGLADVIEVYTRGKEITLPNLEYSTVVNENILSNPQMITADGMLSVGNYNPKKYSSSKEALDSERELQVPSILPGVSERLEKLRVRATKGDEKPYFDEIEEIAANYKAKINI